MENLIEMKQNTSHAVMAQRHEAPNSLDDFPTPPWATRALLEFLVQQGYITTLMSVREPSANRGYMVFPLQEYFEDVLASDIHDYGAGYQVEDFLRPGQQFNLNETPVDWMITNPPFHLAVDFLNIGLKIAGTGCALLLRSVWAESGARYEHVFEGRRPDYVLQFSERVPMVRGRCDGHASTATSYSWFVWRHAGFARRTVLDWIPPGTRKRLERPGDYDHNHDKGETP